MCHTIYSLGETPKSLLSDLVWTGTAYKEPNVIKCTSGLYLTKQKRYETFWLLFSNFHSTIVTKKAFSLLMGDCHKRFRLLYFFWILGKPIVDQYCLSRWCGCTLRFWSSSFSLNYDVVLVINHSTLAEELLFHGSKCSLKPVLFCWPRLYCALKLLGPFRKRFLHGLILKFGRKVIVDLSVCTFHLMLCFKTMLVRFFLWADFARHKYWVLPAEFEQCETLTLASLLYPYL